MRNEIRPRCINNCPGVPKVIPHLRGRRSSGAEGPGAEGFIQTKWGAAEVCDIVLNLTLAHLEDPKRIWTLKSLLKNVIPYDIYFKEIHEIYEFLLN